jgi:hypothetical protein
MNDTAKPDLKSQPRELVVSGKEIRVIDEIKLRGGFVCGMAQVGNKNGQWKLLIHWPERALIEC